MDHSRATQSHPYRLPPEPPTPFAAPLPSLASKVIWKDWPPKDDFLKILLFCFRQGWKAPAAQNLNLPIKRTASRTGKLLMVEEKSGSASYNGIQEDHLKLGREMKTALGLLHAIGLKRSVWHSSCGSANDL